jgi:hypothetical protein
LHRSREFYKSGEVLQCIREALIIGVSRIEYNSLSHHSFPKPHPSGERREFAGKSVEVRFRAVTFEMSSQLECGKINPPPNEKFLLYLQQG